MARVRGILQVFAIVLFGLNPTVWALDTTDVLPIGVRNLSFRLGSYSGLNQAFTETGDLKYLGDINSITFDVATLTQLDSRVQELTDILNDFEAGLGDQLNLGKLSVDANPEITYMAPMFLYGKTKHWTLGLAIPVVTYKNSISTRLSTSNFQALRSEVSGVLDELDTAFQQLNVDLRQEFFNKANSAGYKGLENRNDTFIGDVQMISMYQLPESTHFRSAFQLVMGVPTGPKPDANDIADVEVFGRTSVKPAWIAQKRIHARSQVVFSLGYMAVLPRNIEKRVPKDSSDSLPGTEQRQNLTEDPGDTATAQTSVSWEYSKSLSMGLGIAREEKFSDRYSPSRVGDVRLLEKNTASAATIMKFEMNLSSVSEYLTKKVAVPAHIFYEFSQTLAGVNVENQTRHDIWMGIYF